jgi:4-hydroxyphenylpyruvate dioxygenase
MHKGIATVSVSGTLEDKLQAISAAKFDGIELFDNDLVASHLRPGDVAKRCADLGLSIDLFQPVRDVEGLTGDAFIAAERRFRHKLAVMDGLGATTVLVCSNATSDAVPDLDRSAEQLHALGDVAREHGVVIAFEALAWGTHINRVRQAWELVTRADHPNVSLAVDTFHVLARGDDAGALGDIPASQIAFLQVADAPHLHMDLLQWSRHHRCFPGQGTLDVVGVVDEVVTNGYRGPLSLEVFSDVVREAPVTDTALVGMRSLLHLEEQLRHRWDVVGDDRERPHVVLFDPPPAPLSVESAFVEFAVHADDVVLTELLGGLGFRPAGTHRTKPVTWWRNGDAHVVLNESSELCDGRGATLHRPATTALCLQTPDVDSVGTRSAALLWPAVRRQRGAGEALLPGLSTPSGTHVFISAPPGEVDHWRDDFIPIPTDDDREGWLGLDHVGISVDADDIDAEVFFYRSLFGLRSGPVTEFMDPQGRVLSQVLRPQTGDLRVVLSVAAAARSVPLVTGVVQLAFGCADIFTEVTRLQARGMQLLAIPDNYYDDLEARFDLDPDFIRSLRDHGLMYDKDASGEFLHAYTEMVDGRFYVELLQRVGDYAGFGAPNTHIRLAAQAARSTR